jgi:hypothetical protein
MVIILAIKIKNKSEPQAQASSILKIKPDERYRRR